MSIEATRVLRDIAGGDYSMPRQPATTGNDLQLFVDPPEITKAMADDVRRSRLTNLTMWGLADNGGYASTLLDALKGSAHAGNEVNLMYDWIGTLPFQGLKSGKQVRSLREAGVDTKPYMHGLDGRKPPGAYVFSYDHRKMALMLTDQGPVAWIGGTNLAKQFDDFHDTMVRVTGPAAAQIWIEILGRWTEQGGKLSSLQETELRRALATIRPEQVGGVQPPTGETGAATRAATPSLTSGVPAARGGVEGALFGPANLRPTADGPVVRLATNTPRGDLEITEEFYEAARSAKHRFYATTPSVWSESMVQALRDAAERGVDVRVVVARDKARDPLLRQMTKSYFAELVDSGVKVYDSPRHLHGKLWAMDDAVMVGSSNLNFPSRFSEFESGIFTDDPKLRSQVDDVFAKLFDGTDPVTREAINETHTRFWGTLRRFLNVR